MEKFKFKIKARVKLKSPILRMRDSSWKYKLLELNKLIQNNIQGASRKTLKIMNDITGKLLPCLVGKVKKLNGEVIKSPPPQKLLDE